MNYLSVENVTRHIGERTLFEKLSFGLNRGDKTALIASNGAGKSTLLKIISGKEIPDEGLVTFRNSVRWAFLEQEPDFNESLTIRQLLDESATEVKKVIQQYHTVLENHHHDTKALEEAMAKMDQYHAWDHEREMEAMLSQFELNNLDVRIGSLSGGQKKRLALARVLLDHPDLLILDEPTNHLDVEVIEWLEEYLMQSKLTLLMVTHDRYFLDRVCNSIFELSEGKLYRHNGNYSYFLEKKAEREEVFSTEVAKARQLMKKELEWIRRQPKARGTKAKYRVEAFGDIQKKASSGVVKKDIQLEVKMSRIGGKILELKKVRKHYGDLVILDGFDYTFKKGERIGVAGKNGVGKTTFLNILTGEETVDSGKVNQGESIVFGYYSQQGIKLKEDLRVIEAVREVADFIETADGKKLSASQFLQLFLFTPEMQYTFVSKLSGGERRRLYLMMVLIKNPNFLILDEPTNDLDLLTLTRLEEFLSGFQGCLIVVSHDRYFMDKLVDHLFIFEGDGKILDYTGSYSDYREEEAERIRQEKKTDSIKPLPRVEKEEENIRKLTFKEKIEFEGLEKEISLLEAEKAKLEAELATGSVPYDQLADKSARIGELIHEIELKTLRWLELCEIAG